MRQIRFTKEGYNNLKREYDELVKKRPGAVLNLKKAREMGDLSENGYYKASRANLSEIDAKLKKTLFQLRNAEVVEKTGKNRVGIGNKITLSNEKNKLIYQIVGDLEANPGLGKISLQSPFGKAVENKEVGERIEIDTPNGKISYKLLKIE